MDAPGAGAPGRRAPLILIIDDSPTIRKIVEVCLGREGFEVKSFCDGVEAMRWFTSERRVPALIILDVGLPRLDGFEVACRIKRHAIFEETVIVILSRRDGMMNKLKGRLAGAKEYIVKPFKTEMLVAVVEKYVGRQDEERDPY
jgi:DNA-binding response OmpR family regulator